MSESTEWPKRLEQMDRRVASTVEKMVRDLEDLASAAEDEAVGQLLAATARVDGESGQGEILTALLEEGRRFASRTAFFLTQPEEVRGWAGRGFGSGAAPIESARFRYEEGSAWARLAAKAGAVALSDEECAAVGRALEVPPGSQGVLIPFMLRGQLGGALYADRPDDEGTLGTASLQLLTHTAAQTIETAAVRGDGSSPTLRSSAEDRPVSLWQPPAEEDESGTAAAAVAVAATAAAGAVAEVIAEDSDEAAIDEAAIEEEPVAEEPVADAAAEEAADEAGEPGTEAVDFEMVPTDEADEPPAAVEDEEVTAEEVAAAELVPEPELEDTSDTWTVEEEKDGDDEPAVVGSALADEEKGEEQELAAAVLPEVGQETVRLDVAALQSQVPASEEETAKLPQWEVEQAPEPAAEEAEPEPEKAVTEAMPAPDFSEDATMISSRADLEPHEPSTEAGGYVPPAPTEVEPPTAATPPPSDGFAAPPAKGETASTTQVVPPTDIQGPGSAFASGEGGIPEGEEALHEEARRLARLLVSEIKLYNEEIIEEGRRAGNVYDRLKDDIDRSRQMYEERIDPRLHESGIDYFHQELVQRLAGGDEKLLGY